jgi:hypothetical protein
MWKVYVCCDSVVDHTDVKKAIDSADSIDVDNLQLQVIITNYSYILIRGTFFPAEDIMTCPRLLHTCESSYMYAGTYVWQSTLSSSHQSTVQDIHNE